MGWTDTARVARALGPSVPADDPYLGDCVDASNAWCYRKRAEAGYNAGVDPDTGLPIPEDPDVSPSADVTMAATRYAVALWRERASTEGFSSYEDLSSFAVTGGDLGQIRRLLGVGRGRVDRPDPYGPNRRRHPYGWGWGMVRRG